MRHRQLIPAIGVIALVGAAGGQAANLAAQGLPAGTDLSAAAMVEVRDAQGVAVLRGQFSVVEDNDGEQERYAALGPAGSDLNAAGEAEVVVARTNAGALEQEVEVSVRNLAPNAIWTIFIDGRGIGSLTTGGDGTGELEIDSGS